MLSSWNVFHWWHACPLDGGVKLSKFRGCALTVMTLIYVGYEVLSRVYEEFSPLGCSSCVPRYHLCISHWQSPNILENIFSPSSGFKNQSCRKPARCRFRQSPEVRTLHYHCIFVFLLIFTAFSLRVYFCAPSDIHKLMACWKYHCIPYWKQTDVFLLYMLWFLLLAILVCLLCS